MKSCFFQIGTKRLLLAQHAFLVGGWTTHLKKNARQIGSSSQVVAKIKHNLKPPPSFSYPPPQKKKHQQDSLLAKQKIRLPFFPKQKWMGFRKET